MSGRKGKKTPKKKLKSYEQDKGRPINSDAKSESGEGRMAASEGDLATAKAIQD